MKSKIFFIYMTIALSIYQIMAEPEEQFHLSRQIKNDIIEFKTISPYQFETLKDLYKKAFGFAYDKFSLQQAKEEKAEWYMDYFEHQCKTIKANPSAIKTLVAFNKSNMIGFIEFKLEEKDTARIILIGVDPAYMGLGLGKEFINIMQTMLPEAKHISVFSRTINKDAHAFYTKLGFKQIDSNKSLENYDSTKLCYFQKDLN